MLKKESWTVSWPDSQIFTASCGNGARDVYCRIYGHHLVEVILKNDPVTFYREKETMEEAEGTAETSRSQKKHYTSQQQVGIPAPGDPHLHCLSGTLCTKSLVDFDH